MFSEYGSIQTLLRLKYAITSFETYTIKPSPQPFESATNQDISSFVNSDDLNSMLTEPLPSLTHSESSPSPTVSSILTPLSNPITCPETCTIGTNSNETEPLTPRLVHSDNSIFPLVSPSISTHVNDSTASLTPTPESTFIDLDYYDYTTLTPLVKSVVTKLSLGLTNSSVDASDPRLTSSVETLTQWLDSTTDLSDSKDLNSIKSAIESLEHLMNDSVHISPPNPSST